MSPGVAVSQDERPSHPLLLRKVAPLPQGSATVPASSARRTGWGSWGRCPHTPGAPPSLAERWTWGEGRTPRRRGPRQARCPGLPRAAGGGGRRRYLTLAGCDRAPRPGHEGGADGGGNKSIRECSLDAPGCAIGTWHESEKKAQAQKKPPGPVESLGDRVTDRSDAVPLLQPFSDTRRGTPACHRRLGQPSSACSGSVPCAWCVLPSGAGAARVPCPVVATRCRPIPRQPPDQCPRHRATLWPSPW